MAWLSVSKSGVETIHRNCPIRYRSFWIDIIELELLRNTFKLTDIDEDCSVELPSGSIEKLIGKQLTWEDEPFEIE